MNGLFPRCFWSFKCIPRSSIHDHGMRSANLIEVERTRTVMAENRIHDNLATVLNIICSILNKIDTHCLEGFLFDIKHF